VSVELGYLKRWLQNFTATDNLAVAPADFTPFSIAAPADPRLPNGGGYSVDGLYNVVASKFGLTSNNVTLSDQQIQNYNGLLASFSARIRNGLTLQGGVNSGKQVTDYCGMRASLPEISIGIAGATLSPTNPYCRVDPGLVTKVSFVGSYTVPKVDVLLAGTYRSDQGAPLRATQNVPVAQVSAALGRPANVAGTTVPIDLIAPGQVWGDRVNEIDLRVAKVFRFGNFKTNVGFDIFNLVNSSAVLTYNQTYIPNGQWLVPQSVISPRFFKISAQIDF